MCDKNSMNQRIKPGIIAQGVDQWFHFEVQHVLRSILVALLKPRKCLVFVSERNVHNRTHDGAT
jgi:hypothetical protein